VEYFRVVHIVLTADTRYSVVYLVDNFVMSLLQSDKKAFLEGRELAEDEH